MAVLHLLAHRHGKGHAESADEVALLVAVVNEGVDHPHRFLAGVEIQPDHERQPLAGAFRALVLALQLDHGAHRPRLLDRHFLELGFETLAHRRRRGVAVGTVLQDADQPAVAGDLATVDDHRLDELRAPLRDATFQPAGVDLVGRVAAVDLDRRPGGDGRSGAGR